MKLNINRFQYKATEGEGGFTEQETAELKSVINEISEKQQSGNLKATEELIKKSSDVINESIKKFAGSVEKLEGDAAENQKALDSMLIQLKGMQKEAGRNEDTINLQEAVANALELKENKEGMESVAKGRGFVLELKGRINLSAPMKEIIPGQKAVGDMTQANILSGQGYVSYNNRQALLPAQKVNARDMVDTTYSPTGIYVTYKETAGQGSVSKQTEGSAKTQIDFRLSRVETILDYIAAYLKISKQLMANIPYIQSTLPRLLQREFFKVENRRFYDVMATAFAASGTTPNSNNTTGPDTDDLLQLMDWITQLADTDYSPSFGVLRYTALNGINKSILTKGYYPGAGGITSGPQGNIMVNGTPVYPVTWVPSFDKALIFDSSYVERVERDGLKIEFFEQDSDNVEKNLITARIECQEDFNEMQPLSIILGDFGNSSTS